MISEEAKSLFTEAVWEHYRQHGRHDLPWRQPAVLDAYHIVVSEIMLQQTQVSRVIPKYSEFLVLFPSVHALAAAEQGEVLRAWSGLGYNRRARYLHQAARAVVSEYNGNFPADIKELTSLPGIGVNTAGAILAYAYNQPVNFIETNIRTVYIHHFFAESSAISDKEILDIAKELVDKENPREWYWALMDYGSHIKQTVGNLNKLSKTYSKQSMFHGSKRQIRGQVLKLLKVIPQTYADLQTHISDERLPLVIEDLLSEGLIMQDELRYRL